MENEINKVRAIPGEYIGTISVQKLQDTIAQLDAAVADVLEATKLKEAAYQDKAERLKRKMQLDTQVKITEADAIMMIRGDGKDAHVIVAGEKVAMTNDSLRDAYRRMASKAQRELRAVEEAEIAKIDINLAQINDRLQAAKDTAEVIRAKANLQAALLKYLVI